MDSQFSLNVLCYGPHTDLARRCLGSFDRASAGDWADVRDVRIGLNDVCPETLQYVKQWCMALPVPCYLFQPEKNVGKYPLMTRMFHQLPLTAPWTLWFDDDSHVTSTDSVSWFRQLLPAVQQHDPGAEAFGIKKGMAYLNQQQAWVMRQPWFAGRILQPKVIFFNGGFWGVKTEILKKWRWPIPELIHNGGDTMFGELLRQQAHTVVYGDFGVSGNDGPRRNKPFNRAPVGYHYDPLKPVDLSHHNFSLQVTANKAGVLAMEAVE